MVPYHRLPWGASTAGAQGTFGGLSETAYRLPRILDRALHRVELCSNDPVCAEHEVGSPLGRVEHALEAGWV